MFAQRGDGMSLLLGESARKSQKEVQNVEVPKSFIYKLHTSISKGLPHAIPVSSLLVNESELVQGILELLLGYPSYLFIWDNVDMEFVPKEGIYVSHLSQASLEGILKSFLFAGACLRRVELFIRRVDLGGPRAPTLSAFSYSVQLCLRVLREAVLKEQGRILGSDDSRAITLLALTSSFSSLCAEAEQLYQIVHEGVPDAFLDPGKSIPACEIAVYILDHLFMRLNEVSLLEDCEGSSYSMLLTVFTGSLLPYLQGLDSWLYDGILDDPYEEMFFYANNSVSIDQPAFWDTSYLLRRQMSSSLISGKFHSTSKQHLGESIPQNGLTKVISQSDPDFSCPLFLKGIANAIVSAGKSLQLIQHVHEEHQVLASWDAESHRRSAESDISKEVSQESMPEQYKDDSRIMGVLSLCDVFLISLVGLLENSNHLHDLFSKFSTDLSSVKKNIEHIKEEIAGEYGIATDTCEKIWFKLLVDALPRNTFSYPKKNDRSKDVEHMERDEFLAADKLSRFAEGNHVSLSQVGAPAATICWETLKRNPVTWNNLNISTSFHLPPLNDENLREDIFGGTCSGAGVTCETLTGSDAPRLQGTDYRFGFQYDSLGHRCFENDRKTLEALYAFPTLLPSVNENASLSDILPFQRNSTLASRALKFVQCLSSRNSLQPVVFIQECLIAYVNQQVDHVGKHVLSKMMVDWRLMDELFVLRSIYLLGSGDLLQHFLIVIFNMLDKGKPWDDEFELNTILQESIRNSSDCSLLPNQESLVVSIAKHDAIDEEGRIQTPRKVHSQGFGIDVLDSLRFTYKITWPLDLIANKEALKKYNQVMGFLLKVKRAKFVLSKTRKWMWKCKGRSHYHKRHLILEQKLLFFVDAFHQYVMDRVYHSAWTELCVGMASAGSLDEVIDMHEAYLSSIHRQCFVAPDKLWALIASRVKTILGLALDFHNVQQTIFISGSAQAIKMTCELEVDRIGKQFDECMAFLLRILSVKLNVGLFPHLADLVTRINYNYFYMSESGNLLTAPRQSTSISKLAKGPSH